MFIHGITPMATSNGWRTVTDRYVCPNGSTSTNESKWSVGCSRCLQTGGHCLQTADTHKRWITARRSLRSTHTRVTWMQATYTYTWPLPGSGRTRRVTRQIVQAQQQNRLLERGHLTLTLQVRTRSSYQSLPLSLFSRTRPPPARGTARAPRGTERAPGTCGLAWTIGRYHRCTHYIYNLYYRLRHFLRVHAVGCV